MPQSFARTDSVDSAWSQNSQSWQHGALQPPFTDRTTEPPRTPARARAHDGALDAMIARHASASGVPVELVRRVVTRESGYNPRARNGGALGLMQIKYATARSMGYSGPASGLLDAETNLTYAVRYLAGAYHAAGSNQGRAVALYASGYRGRGVAVARRASPVMVAEAAAPSAQPLGMQASPVAMQSEAVMARRHVYRHRAR
jgi:soluble lytic murein transglycosylase-like protein